MKAGMKGIWKYGQKVWEAIFLFGVTEIAAPGICVHCTTILEGSVDVFIFDIDGKSTLLISIQNGHFRYVYMGVMMSGMIPEREGKGQNGHCATKESSLMQELRYGRKREWSHG